MKTVAVIFGGRSVEHDISIITGQFVMAALKAAGQFEVVPVYIAKDGVWHSDPSLAELKTFQDPALGERLNRLKTPTKALDGRFALTWPGLRSKTINVDVAFPCLHGTYGEDGSLQGLLRLANVPFVGCNLEASVIAMDKVLTKQALAQTGTLSVPYVWFSAREWASSRETITTRIKGLDLPWFTKPAHLGSSIGITRVDKKDHLENAIEVALHYDDKVIVEQGVKDPVEINCAVMGNDIVRASQLEQPLTKAEFLSFDDKYIGSSKKGGSMSGAKANVRIPAPLPADQTKKIQEIAVLAFKAIGASGTARFDFLIDPKTSDAYLNEINPLPGSLQAHLWKASGISNVELVTKLVELAQERFAAQRQLTTTFDSSVLNQRGGTKATSA
ncbi:MAG TPA: D-alanine--D-alanine ligase family protein [Candidatus Saccharimonadales bacterium]|nr:D-alanine--D-alanine ligase family protein [Candidatus Saccharimonadales bacterium]